LNVTLDSTVHLLRGTRGEQSIIWVFLLSVTCVDNLSVVMKLRQKSSYQF